MRRHRGAPWCGKGGGIAAGCCLRGGGAFCGTLPLKIAWRPLLRGSGAALLHPRHYVDFFFFLTLFVPIDVVPQATPRQRLSVLPSRCPPARSRSCGMRWGSALLCVWGQERRCRTGAVPAPRRCLCVRPEVTLAAIAIRVLGW